MTRRLAATESMMGPHKISTESGERKEERQKLSLRYH